MRVRHTSPDGRVFISPSSLQDGLIAVLYDFDIGGDSLKSNHMQLLGNRVAQMLHDRTKRIAVEGHASPRADEEYNLDLSRRRATSVVNYLLKRGVHREQLYEYGVGESQPIIPGADNDARDRSVIILVRRGDPPPPPPPITRRYRIHLRAFAPWREFGGAIPASVTPRGWINNINYRGDDRGFSVETGNRLVTSRINFQASVDITGARVTGVRAWSDPSHGPWLFLGPEGEETASPRATVASHRQSQPTYGSGLRADISVSGPNPLVPLSPAINARSEYIFTLATDGPLGPRLIVNTRLSGDQFPACETFLDDDAGGKVFLGGYAPPSMLDLLRLFGGLNQPRYIYFTSNVTILLGADGRFREVFGAWGTQSSPPMLPLPSSRFSLSQWNQMLMRQIPMPPDAQRR